MNKVTRSLHLIVAFLMIGSILAACSKPTIEVTPEPTKPPTAIPSQTPKPTETATATITPSPTPIPSATPTPTSTSTPTLEPTPIGYYVDNLLGYSFTHPANWEYFSEQGTSGFIDAIASLFFFANSVPSSDPLPVRDAAELVKDASFPDAPATYGDPYEVEAADGQMLDAIDTTIQIEGGTLNIRVLVHEQNGQTYIFFLLATPENMASRGSAITRTFKTMKFFPPNPFGTNPQETLYVLGSEPDETDLDPALALGGVGSYAGLLHAGLVRFTPQVQIVPELADSWTISPDGTVYTFTLKANLQFADGKPITAESFQQSWERAADPATESSVAKTYLGDILGFTEKLDGEADTISGLKVIDDLTLQVTLDGPKPYFLAKLTYPTSFVVDVSQTSDDQWMFSPNASGPYIFKDYLEQNAMLFERNDKYYDPVSVRNLVFNLNPGGSTISLYESNRLDIAYLDAEETLRVRSEDDPLHAEWQSSTTMCTQLIQLNNSLPPFDDPMVRQAFVQAIDPNLLNENLSQSTNRVANSILPPAMPGYSSDLAPLPFDPASARAALEESTYADNLPEIVINAGGYADSQRRDVAALAEMWKTNLGVQVKVVYLDPIDYSKAARENHGQLVIYGWCADYPDPENFLDLLYHSESDMNVAGYSNPEVDALLEQARVELDPAKRLALYYQAEKLLLEDFAALPTTYSVTDVLVKPRVQGFTLTPVDTVLGVGIKLVEP